jgi:uncharacterized protein with HEPN domain
MRDHKVYFDVNLELVWEAIQQIEKLKKELEQWK